jgi:cellobiose phosphorylase
LHARSEKLKSEIREREYFSSGDLKYFNGYYNNQGVRVEGEIRGVHQMSLTAQVFPIMSKTATDEQSAESFKAAKKLLCDAEHGGYRLNTDFGQPMLDLGRAYSFAYGEKENGAFFSHMCVMFAQALYKRGMVSEGYEVLSSIYSMCKNTEKSMIFPCVPEYFNSQGRGRYCYITGSASWFVMTMVTWVFGIRGSMGRLLLAPRLVKEQWAGQASITLATLFQGVRIEVCYQNSKGLSPDAYKVSRIELDGETLSFEARGQDALLSRDLFEAVEKTLHFDVWLTNH